MTARVKRPPKLRIVKAGLPPQDPTSLQFFAKLKWIDGRSLLGTLEPYRKRLFTEALDRRRADGVPVYNLVLSGRAKKNFKTTDLVLAAFYCLLIRKSPQGSNCLLLANDLDQAADDLSLAKKLVEVNPELSSDLHVKDQEIVRRDGKGSLRILPARDVPGAHGKTAVFVGFDEIHAYKNYDLIEALTPDPTRADALVWICSYDTIHNTVGIPLYDLKALGRDGTDPRMLFSWYSADLCTDPAFADLEPELKANPSINSWPEGRKYLDQQRGRLPTHKFRRLHLNLPGAPDGSFFDQGAILNAVIKGRTQLPAQPSLKYHAFVDMSGGSNDDAALAIAHRDANSNRVVIDHVATQAGGTPFNPRAAVVKFSHILKRYGLRQIWGDDYGGEIFKSDFREFGFDLKVSPLTASELYEEFEPRLNAGEIELPDLVKLTEQFTLLVLKNSKVTHPSGEHDDLANACAGAAWLVFTKAAWPALKQVLANPRLQGERARGNSTGFADMRQLVAASSQGLGSVDRLAAAGGPSGAPGSITPQTYPQAAPGSYYIPGRVGDMYNPARGRK